MSSDNLDHVFKILLIGDAGVGKSSILLQFTDGILLLLLLLLTNIIIIINEFIKLGYFNDNLQSTIGVDFKVKVMDAAGIILLYLFIICIYCY